jgi:hypothetical protein
VAGVIELTTREPVAPRAFTGTLQYSAYLSPDDDVPMPTPVPAADDDDDDFEEGLSPFYGLRGQFTAAVREDDDYVIASLTGAYTRGWMAGTRSHLVDASLKIGRAYAGGGAAYVWLRGFDSFSGAPSWGSLIAADAFDADDRIARQGMQAMTVYRRNVGTRLSLEGGASLTASRSTLLNPDADLTAGSTSLEARQRATEFQGRVALTHESQGVLGTLTAGIDFGRETLATENLGSPAATRAGVFVRDQLRAGVVVVDLAARLDGDSLYGWFVSPRASLRATAGDLARFELAAARGYRPPSFSERAWPTFLYGSPSAGAIGERGNPQASVERAWGLDAAAVLGGGTRRWHASLRAFGLYTENLLRWSVDNERYWTPTNTGAAWSAGATLDASLRITPKLSLIAGAFWQNTRDDAGDEVLGRLRTKATGRVVWYERTGLRAWLEALWFERSGTDGRGEPWRGVFVNARIGWQFRQGVGAFLLGENLTDTRFESVRGLPTPGRVLWLGLSLDVDED